MVSRGLASREFAGRSSIGIKFANLSNTMPVWSVHRLFFFKAFQLLLLTYWSIPLSSKLIDIVKMIFFFFTFLSHWIIYTYTYRFFDNISHTCCKKEYGHPLLGLSSKVFTFDHLFPYRSDFFNTLATYLAEWPEYRKNKCLSSSTNRVGLHFRKRVEKINSCTFEGNIKKYIY